MNDDIKHQQAVTADEELGDEESPLGSMSKESEDIDETLESVGLASDKNGPRELNSEAVIDRSDKNQE